MRTFILSLVVFCLLIGILWFTGRYIARRTDELMGAANSLPIPDDSGENRAASLRTIESFVNRWSSMRKTIHFIIGHEEADKIDETLTDLRIRFVTKDDTGYMAAREKLLFIIQRLSDSESLSFDNVT